MATTKTKSKATAAGFMKDVEFRRKMTELAGLLDSTAVLAADILNRHVTAVVYYGHERELQPTLHSAECFADLLKSNGVTDV
jgi:hypothetical protein